MRMVSIEDEKRTKEQNQEVLS